MHAYPHVFTPFDLGGVQLRNRIFIAAHTTNFGHEFLPTDRHVAYLGERSRGGVGLIFTEGIRVHPTSVGRAGALIGYDDRALPGFRRIAEAVHAGGAAIFGQILHAGRHSDNIFLRTAAWGPSALPSGIGSPVPHAMTPAEIDEIVAAHVATAQRLREAGFDGLEVQIGHGHLLHQFLSPLANVRDDAYGGSEENRLRFPIAVIQAVIHAVGNDMVVGVRMSADDFEAGGVDLAASQRIIAAIAAAAPIRFVNVSHASNTSPSLGLHVADMHYGPAPFRHLPLGIRDAVPDLPVFAVCRFTDLRLAEEVIATGAIDMVGMTRAHIADPHILRKTLAGREGEVRPCVSCNSCIGQLELHQPITCLMNPTVGREQTWSPDIPPADHPRRVLVVGGGPAGLEAARVAAEQGHSVDLWEAAGTLGGQIRVGRNGTGRADLDKLRAYHEAQLRRLSVTIRLDTEATAEMVLDHGADIVLLATGARPVTGTLPGWGAIESAASVLAHAESPDGLRQFAGTRVALLDSEGGWTAASAAETLARTGAEVHVIVPGSSYLPRVNGFSRMTTVDRLGKLGVRLRLLRRAVRYDAGTLTIADSLTGDEETLSIDHLVAARPAAAHRPLSDALANHPNIHTIGDADAPRSLLEAIFEAHRVARSLA